MEPIFEWEFAEHSYGFRPERCCKDDLGRVRTLKRKDYRYVVGVGMKDYYDSIPHEQLLQREGRSSPMGASCAG